MKRYLPLLLIITLTVIAYTSGYANYLTFENLRHHREHLVTFVVERPFAAPLIYIAAYALSVALSIPGAIFLTLFGGFLFPQPFATFYVLVGATAGAIAIFLAAKTALGEFMKRRAGGLLKKMEAGFKHNSASYLLFLRLVPAFPFWLVNLAPAFFNVSLRTFVWTTFFGIMPGTFVFTQAGRGIGSILDSGEELSLSMIFTTDVKIALCALGIFSLLPMVVRWIKGNGSNRTA
jgi:uncharacterized membrane protein YdjX (TVP38/TMEM64 family)